MAGERPSIDAVRTKDPIKVDGVLLMLGTTLRDDTFINVVYQETLDVLDVPFRIRPNVTALDSRKYIRLC